MVQRVNVTLDDYSPVIEYEPRYAWRDGSTEDPFWNSYTNNGTFTTTTIYGASASLTFNGTGIWIYGAKRSNHGPYSVTLDGEPYRDNGFYDGQIFQQVLFSAVGLDATKPHTVSIVNSRTDAGKPYLDIDSIVYQMEFPDNYQEVKQQDTVTNFQYSASGWSTNPDNLSSYDSNTGHSTSLGDAYVNYTFQGSHVELYGALGPSGGPFTVQIDGGPEKTLNALRSKFTPQMVLYQQSGLGPGNHTMKIMNAPFSGQTLSIDYVTVVQSPNDANSPASTSASQPSPQLSGGVIGGIVAGISGLLFVTMAVLLLWYRRRHRKPMILPQDVLEAEFTENDEESDPGDSSTRLTPFLNSAITRYRAVSPPPAPISFPSTGNDSSAQGGPSLYRSSHLLGHTPASSPGFVVRNAGGGAGGNDRSLSDAAEEKRRLGATMRERARQMESGAQGVGLSVDYVSGNENGDDIMPPDYHQATQPSTSRARPQYGLHS